MIRKLSPNPPPDSAEACWQKGLLLWDEGKLDEAKSCLEQALRANSGRAEWHNEFGMLLMAQGDSDRAAQSFREALRLNPQLAHAYCNLGIILQRQSGQDALACFRRAIELKPDLVEAHYNSGLALRETGRTNEAIANFERALKLRPGHADAWCNLGFAKQDLGLFDGALSCYSHATELQPDHAEAHLSKAFIHLLNGEFKQGWEEYEYRYFTAESPRRNFSYPDWDGSPLQGRTLLVYAEQGLGDEILFAGCLPELIAQAKHVVIDCEPRLSRLFAHSFPTASVHGGKRDEDTQWLRQMPPIDVKIAAGSVPKYLRNSLADFPVPHAYLRADPERVAHWRRRLELLGPGLKVGISWQGGLPQTRRALRSIDLERWLPILKQADKHFVSLQYTECREELSRLRESHGILVHQFQEAMDDYDETAALICALDGVISVCTALVHLSGALGKPAWVMVPFTPEWRYLAQGNTLPWYPLVRLFRQPDPGGWREVIDSVSRELQQRGQLL